MRLPLVGALVVLLSSSAFAQVPPDPQPGPFVVQQTLPHSPDPEFGRRALHITGDLMFVSGTDVITPFARTNNVWVAGAPISVGNEPGFGDVIDSDGTRLIAGRYIFVKQSAGWVLETILPGNEPGFGFSVGISGDSAIVSFSGGAKLFRRTAGQWAVEQVLLEDPIGLRGPWIVAIRGSRALAIDDPKFDATAYVLDRLDGVWTVAYTQAVYEVLAGAFDGQTAVASSYPPGAPARIFDGEHVTNYTLFGPADGPFTGVAVSGDWVAVANARTHLFHKTPAGTWTLSAMLTGGRRVALDGDTLAAWQDDVIVHVRDTDHDGVRDSLDRCPDDGEDDCGPRQPQPEPEPPVVTPEPPVTPDPPSSSPQPPDVTPDAPPSQISPGPTSHPTVLPGARHPGPGAVMTNRHAVAR